MEVPLPLVIRARARTVLVRLVALTCLAMFAGTGAALADGTSGSCPSQPLSTPFAQWGDTSDYFLVPGGSFEGTADQVGWTLNNATLTSGNEPWYVNSPTDDQSLTISGGGSATSPFFCVDNTMPDLRFFAQEVTAGSDLEVKAILQTAWGQISLPIADLADGSMSNWSPTTPIGVTTGPIPSGQSMQVALEFSLPASSGDWQVDDVYFDPYRSG